MRNFINLVESFLNLPRGGVRTEIHTHAPLLDNPAFNAWFDGSRVCDRDGNPLVCFHGTFFDFTRFQNKDLGKGGAGNGFNSIGYWFDTDTGVPEWLAGHEEGYGPGEGSIYPCVLSIKKPFALDSEWLFDGDRERLKELRAKLRELRAKREKADSWGKMPDGSYFNEQELMKTEKEWKALYHSVTQERDDGFYRLMKLLPNGIQSSTAEVMAFKKELMDEGYDGIWMGDTIADFGQRDYRVSDWWIAFEPNQIKSLFAKEFNPDSDHINESMDAVVPWTWSYGSPEDIATFNIDDRVGKVYFFKHPSRTICTFSINGIEDVTGGGDAFVIFATVLRIMTEYLNKNKPSTFEFSAKSREASRVSLYRTFLKRFAPKWGYDVDEEDDHHNGENIFTLTRKTMIGKMMKRRA